MIWNLKPCKCGCTRLRLLTDYEKMWHIECPICFRMGVRVNTPVGAVDFWNGDYVSFEGYDHQDDKEDKP